MAKQHRDCDNLFADAEAAVADKQWDLAQTQVEAFIQSMQEHLGVEEDLLFPAFEEQTHQTAGPTHVMRMEHEQMRELFQELTEYVANRDAENFLGASETLMTLMQQHNIKEEQVLYTMMDRVLDKRDELLQKIVDMG